MFDINTIVDKLLDMKPEPIPAFVLLKEFKKISPDSNEYQNAYDEVIDHPFVKKLEAEQNERGFWPSFHGRSEDNIRSCLTYGLDKNHSCLKRVTEYIVRILNNELTFDESEKQDNIRWWPELNTSMPRPGIFILMKRQASDHIF